MREIKFRAWDRIEKKWLYFTLSDLIDGKADRIGLENWCEYTGLKDKNGKEIYEGDIVRICPEDDYDALTGELREYHDYGWKRIVVEWRKEYAGYGFDGEELFSMEYRYSLCDDSFVTEVIGNIYQHPELLAAKPEAV